MSKGVLIKILCTPIILFIITGSKAQCPDNIGFENGTFQNWVISAGKISQTTGAITSNVVDSFYRVNLLKNNYPQELDPFGLFPVNCPNGSNYSIKLGDSVGYGLAQTVSYTFTIPANQDNYSIIYNYAVVLQEPGHFGWAQPSFSSKVFDVTSSSYIDCGAFNFIASSSLPGFQKSATGLDVYYKPWSPMTIKLVGYAGKTIRIEFTTHDCAFGPHFGYAYIDVNENCSSPVSGNVFCNNANSLSLTAPFGFKAYTWYDQNYSQILDTTNILKLSTAPPLGTIYHVVISPYPDLGCLDTLHTTIQFSPQNFKLQTVDSIVACSSNMVDLTASFVTAGSTAGLSFSYFKNSLLTDYEPTPKHVNSTGIYYIKAVNSDGCTDNKPVSVTILQSPALTIHDQTTCGFASIQSPIGFISNQTDLKNSFWKDSIASIPIASPDSITVSGRYYIKSTNSLGCSTVSPISTTIFTIPHFTISPAPIVFYPTSIDLTSLVASTSNTTSNFSYWQDAATTIPIIYPSSIVSSGRYFIKCMSMDGCALIDSVELTIKVLSIVPPNVFSPNNDGINDTWEIPGLQNFPNCTVEVFNRYGQLIFKSNGYPKNWDGTFNHQAVPIGTYYFIIKTGQSTNPVSGSVLIIR